MTRRLTVAGIPVDPLTLQQAAERAAAFLSDGGQHQVVTPNPEMAVLADRDPSFRKILESADLAVPDGFGLRVAARIEGQRIPETITGVDFALTLAELAEQEHCSVYFLGGGEGVAAEAAEALRSVYPKLIIAGAESGGTIRWVAGAWQQDDALIDRVAKAAPDILFVALGHGRQERWIRHHLERLPSVKVAIGLGGALDFYSGRKRRAPMLFRMLRLEWFWRLLYEPWRAVRIFEATFVFLWLVLKKRLGRVR